MKHCILILLLAVLGPAAAVQAETGDAGQTPSKLYGEDGRLDVSGFIDEAYGFVPVVAPITEPAVGYGAAGALVFIDRNKEHAAPGFGRPNISAVGGLGTENGTWGAFAGDSRYWLDDRVQTLAGAVYASVNLDFYGVGNDVLLRDHPLSYTIEPRGGVVQGKYRLGDTRISAGIGYIFFVSQVSFKTFPGDTRLPDSGNVSRVGGALLSITFDSRDNIFTPENGTYLDASAGLYGPALGSDGEFQRISLTAMQFLPLHPAVSFGVRAGAQLSFNDVPFYMRPFVALRGVQAMRYQGEEAAEIEAEARWQFWQRYSLVGFGGWGAAWNDSTHRDNRVTVTSCGVGFRYELARRYGLHMGIDVAWGPDRPAIYVQFGSAWARP